MTAAVGVAVDEIVHAYPGRPPVVALAGVTLEVPATSVLAVLGHSGSGKTSLLRVIAGFEHPQSGRIALGGRVVVDDGLFVPPNRRRVGIVPQEGALFPHLDVAGNIAFGLRHLDRVSRRARVADLLDLVGLAGCERRRPRELSGGQQQRVALARALAPHPAVVLLDEPFSALDAGLRASLRDEVADLLRAAGATAVLVTHDRSDAMAMADHVAVLSHGSVVQTGSPAELYRNPVDRATAELFGDANVLSGTAAGGTITCSLGCLPLAGGGTAIGKVDVLVRPESIVPARPDHRCRVDAVVVAQRFNGIDFAMVLELPDGARVDARWAAAEPPRPGEVIAVAVDRPAWLLRGEDAGRPHGEAPPAIGERDGAGRHSE